MIIIQNVTLVLSQYSIRRINILCNEAARANPKAKYKAMLRKKVLYLYIPPKCNHLKMHPPIYVIYVVSVCVCLLFHFKAD